MVSYVHDLTTTWNVWNPEFNTVRTQSDVIFDEERNAHVSCPESPSQEADPLRLPQEEVHVEVLTPKIWSMAIPVGVKGATIITTIITTIFTMETRALLANTGNSSLKMAAPMGVVKTMASLNRGATMHARWQLADA